MKLDHISLSNLKPSPLNVRKKGGKDIADLLPSIRSLGIIQPLLVRPNCDGFEIVAGQRRFHALTALAQEGIAEPVPCIVMQDGDDAAAIEASLVENIARLPMDEIDQYKAFATLIAKGESVEDIAARFGVTERLVRQRLAIANIIEPILNAYRKEDITPDTLRALTLATPRQQKAWWKLHKSEDEYAPTGRRLREWLLGGSQIPLTNALFDVADYAGPIVSDLFGEEQYFGDAGAFWSLQRKAIADARDRCLDAGWSEVAILEIGQYWQSWEHIRTPKSKSGKVFITCTTDGEVQIHEGYLSTKEASRRERAGVDDVGVDKPPRPELTKAAQNYVDLHRHAAVQSALIGNPGMALKVIAAHIIAGSSLWQVRPEPKRADKPATASSIETSEASRAVDAEHDAVMALLDFGMEDDGFASLVDNSWRGRSLGEVFEALLPLTDEQVIRVMTYAMAETLQAGTALIDTLGTLLSVTMAGSWQAGDAFLGLVANKQTLNSMLADIGGPVAAEAHNASTSKVIRDVISQYAAGEGRQKVEGWLPPYLQFPQGQYEPITPSANEDEVDVAAASEDSAA